MHSLIGISLKVYSLRRCALFRYLEEVYMRHLYSVLTNRYVVPCILIVFLFTVYFHRNRMIHEIEEAIAEHVLVVGKPMWSFESNWVGGYFSAVAKKYNYKSVKLIDEYGDIFHENSTQEQGLLEKYLSRLHLIPLKTFEKDVIYNNDKIGNIVVVWKDTSIYFCIYAFLVSSLLIVIVMLYSRIAGAKNTLEGKVSVIEQQMAELRSQKEFIENIFDVVPEGLVTISDDRKWIRSNHSFELLVREWASILGKSVESVKEFILEGIIEQLQKKPRGHYSMLIEGYTFNIEYSSSQLASLSNVNRVISLRDITKITEMERELGQSRKLEAVGRLASGIAHEINTPSQYVFSNIDFFSDAFADIGPILSDLEKVYEEVDDKARETKLQEIHNALVDADWEFLEEEIPKALNQSREGLRRISSIVSAMKNFSHPSGDTAELANINSAIETTVIVARNEWKYFSDLTLDLDPDLPQIPCYLDELNQVFLSMIVNSAHAITQKYEESSGEKGKIAISTKVAGDRVAITISDDGMGMSRGVKEKIFDPFFTTKALNKGTGQGLAIARDVIVNRHNGTITVDSKEGVGTTFTITLPISLS